MAATTTKPLIVSPISSRATLLLLVSVVVALAVVQTGQVQAQGRSCSADLGNLNVCAPFVLPGATNSKPSTECCSALQSIDHGCICDTLRIASQIPSQCSLPPLACSACNNYFCICLTYSQTLACVDRIRIW